MLTHSLRRALSTLLWNVVLLGAGAALIAGAAEAYLRATVAFTKSSLPREWVAGVGFLYKPNVEVRHTNLHDYWTVQYSNSLGFLDREPGFPERGRGGASCRVVIIGDSFVDAKEVGLGDKLQVRLDELASDHLPELGITTSAFAMSGSGQVAQIPLYDKYARFLRPRLVVLVFVDNDFVDNAPLLAALDRPPLGLDPAHMPTASAQRRFDGTIALRSPDPLYAKLRLFEASEPSAFARFATKVHDTLWLARLLRSKRMWPRLPNDDFQRMLAALGQRPQYGALLAEWTPADVIPMHQALDESDPPPMIATGLEHTAFALEQWKSYADRDGSRILLLAATTRPKSWIRVSKMAAALEIPALHLAEYVHRQGATMAEARWFADSHWSPAGHRWAAEALLEWLQAHPATCTDDEAEAERQR